MNCNLKGGMKGFKKGGSYNKWNVFIVIAKNKI